MLHKLSNGGSDYDIGGMEYLLKHLVAATRLASDRAIGNRVMSFN